MADTPGDELEYEDHSQLPEILPIFPLPNVVLMPNMTLPLYIFEERYKQMVRDCVSGEPYLAIALLKKGWEQQSGPPRPYPVAGFGRIVRAARLPNDCMDIVVQGMGRIDMTEFYDDQPYLRAAVTLVQPTYPAQERLAAPIELLKKRFFDLLDVQGISALELRTNLKLLASPLDVVFFITARLPFDPYVKQEILQTAAVDAQIAQLLTLMERSRGTHLN
jgi:Lon protease-like protein